MHFTQRVKTQVHFMRSEHLSRQDKYNENESNKIHFALLNGSQWAGRQWNFSINWYNYKLLRESKEKGELKEPNHPLQHSLCFCSCGCISRRILHTIYVVVALVLCPAPVSVPGWMVNHYTQDKLTGRNKPRTTSSSNCVLISDASLA